MTAWGKRGVNPVNHLAAEAAEALGVLSFLLPKVLQLGSLYGKRNEDRCHDLKNEIETK